MEKITRTLIFLLLSVCAFIFSSYWIFKNVRLEDLVGDNNISLDIKNDDNEVEERSFEIRGNNIVEILPSGSVRELVNGKDIENIEEIVDLSVSPDGKRICFLVQTVVPIWMYTYDLENGGVVKVDVAKNCYWSPDSSYIAYNNHTTDVSEIDVYLYDYENKKIENLTEDITPIPTDTLRQCEEIQWNYSGSLEIDCSLRKFQDFEDYEYKTFIYDPLFKEIKNRKD